MSYHYTQQPGYPQQPTYPSHQGYGQGPGIGYPQDHQQGYGQQQPQPQPFYGGGNGGYPVAQGYGVPPQPQGYGAPPPPPPMQQQQHQQQPYGAPQQPYTTYPQQTQAPYPTQPYTPLPPAPPVQPSAQPWFLHTLIPSPPPAPPLTPQSLPGYNAPFDVDRVRRATKGFGTDEKVLIDVLCNLDAFQMDLLGRSFEQATGKGLRRVLEKELSGWLENGLVLCSLGPLGGDVHLLHRAMQGMGTHEDLLNEILLSRSNLEIHLLKETYHRTFSRPLITAVQGELSLKTERLFNMVLSGARDESPQVNPQAVQDDLRTLHESGQGRWGTDEITICGILCQRSDAHLAALATGYGGMYGRSLSSVIASEFSGHMKSALLYIVNRAESDGQGIQASADLLESSMAGMGTKDERLVWRVVRCHWNRSRFEAVKLAYHRTYGKTLRKRVEGETTGKYERMLVALIQ